MCGSGAGIGMMETTTRSHPPTIPLAPHPARSVFCGAVPGTAAAGIVVLRIASGAIPTSGTTVGFVASRMWSNEYWTVIFSQ